MRRFRFKKCSCVGIHVTVFPLAVAEAEAEPEPAQAYCHGSGFDFTKPKPGKAEPKPRFSGRAEPAHHYKRRVIVNHSFQKRNSHIELDNLHYNPAGKIIIDPSKTSINTIIDSTKFQCAWGFFSECYLLVANAPEGTQAAVFDVDVAFQNIPTHPSARPFLAIMIKGLIHLDHVLNFGASPSPGIFGRVADAMVKILLNRGIEAVIKWVDDFIFFRYPSRRLSDTSYEFTYSAELIWTIAEELGWPRV